jgi:hypothetical protein
MVLRQHIGDCSDCRAWVEQAAELEAALSQLPAPAQGQAKAQLLARLSQSPPAQVSSTDGHRRNWRWRSVGASVGLAAAVMLGVLIYQLGRPSSSSRPTVAEAAAYPLLQRVVEHDIALARATHPVQRIQILSELAETLAQETGALARIASAEELRDLARWYTKVVERGLIPQAEQWIAHRPAERERQQVLEAARRLEMSATSTEQLLTTVPPHAEPILRHLVQAARDGEQKLKRLSRGERGAG